MEQETILKEILNALKLHGELMESKFDEMNAKMDEGFSSVNQRLDCLEKRAMV